MHRKELPEYIVGHGFVVDEVVAYETHPVPELFVEVLISVHRLEQITGSRFVCIFQSIGSGLCLWTC